MQKQGFIQEVHSNYYEASKRLFDLTFAAILLIFAVPLMAVIAILIKLDSSGPVLFSQERVGRDRKLFTMYKFRTMRHRADDQIHKEALRSYIHGKQVPAFYDESRRQYVAKIVNDPRITRVGRVLRNTGLDELPQLFNVVRGEMSLIGPRPPLPFEVAEYTPRHLLRLRVVPGITGLWQITGRGFVSFDKLVEIDLFYIQHRSLLLDLKILLLTPIAMFTRRNFDIERFSGNNKIMSLR